MNVVPNYNSISFTLLHVQNDYISDLITNSIYLCLY